MTRATSPSPRIARSTRAATRPKSAAFPAAVADLVLVSPASPHPSRGLGLEMIVIAALLAVPSMLVALLVRRRRRDGWLAPMLALTAFLPALTMLGTVFEEGPGDIGVDEEDHGRVFAVLAFLNHRRVSAA